MKLTKNGIRAVGLLVLIGIFAIVGFFVIKPQVESALKLMSDTSAVNDATAIRELRLAELQNESENIDQLRSDVDQLLATIPSAKNVTSVAGAVIDSMPAGVQLKSFSHGDLIPAGPNFAPADISLSGIGTPLNLENEKKTQSEKDPAATDDSNTDKQESSVEVPVFAAAPFIIQVEASRMEVLTEFLDNMQNQDRLITVLATNAGYANGVVDATIYAYAFAGSNPQIEAWENPSAEAE